MITRVTGVINRVLDDEIRLQVGAFEYRDGARMRAGRFKRGSAKR